MTVRGYTAADVPAMIEIWNEVVEEGVAFPQTEKLTDGTFFAEQDHCGVAEEDGRIVGMYILHPNNIGRCGHICNASYAVKGTERGKRIGEALVSDCLVQAKRLGYGVLQFNAVVATNERALRLYKKLGFTPLGVIPKGFRMDGGIYADIIPHYKEL